MCYFITGCVSQSADLVRLNALVAELGLQRHFDLAALQNPHVLAQLPSGLSYCSLGRRQCDCDTAIGTIRKQSETGPSKAKLKKLRSKGWDDRRIERWQNERRQAQAGKLRSVSLSPSHEAELDRWWSLITSSLSSGLTESFGLLKHWYSADVVEEDFQLSIQRASIQNVLTRQILAELAEDTLCLFTGE